MLMFKVVKHGGAMADRLRVPFAKPSARHRAPTWWWSGTRPDTGELPEIASHNHLIRRIMARINVAVALTAGGVLLQGLVNADTRPDITNSSVMSDEQRHAYATKRYAACNVSNVVTGVPASKMRVDWQLHPDATVNQIVQTHLDNPNITFGPSIPVVRMFSVDTNGRPALSREIGREAIDTEGRHDPGHFYAQLPRPQGHVRYALSVRNSVTVEEPNGERETVYGEQQCAELVWHKPSGSNTYRWGHTSPHPALVALDRYIVVPQSSGGS